MEKNNNGDIDLPLFSVIALHYNQPLLWRETVDSVLMQDYPALELVFQDDGSDDFDKKVVEDYVLAHKRDNLRNFTVQSNVVNAGTAENCDNGFAASTGDYVLFLDGDDGFASKGAVSALAAAFQQLPETENVVSANCEIVSIDHQLIQILFSQEEIDRFNMLTAEQQRELMTYYLFPVPSCTAFKRRIFDLCGGFQVPFIRLCQDGYFFNHVLRIGHKFNMIDFITSFHREGGVTHSGSEKVSPNTAACMVEFLRLHEFEVFPYLDLFSKETREKAINKYYENLIAYRMATNDLSYGISEPAYTLMKGWADRNKMPWCFEKSRLNFTADHLKWNRTEGCTLPTEDIDKCCGCTACKSACTVQAISMRENDIGIQMPYIDGSRCIQCGECAKVCPVNHSGALSVKKPKAYYAVKCKDLSIRKASRSGGFFYVAAQAILKKGGVVYGAAFDKRLEVHHIRVDEISQLHRLQGSKYVQSSMDEIYPMVIRDLSKGALVLFSGTPCQVAGLLHDCRCKQQNTDRLITIDTVCHGVPSPKIYREYLDFAERAEKVNLISFSFRDKQKGWRSHEESYSFIRNGMVEKKFSTNYTDLFYEHVIFRPSCYSCPYTSFKRLSDITIADFWGIEKTMPEFEDQDGVSLVMLRSKKGMNLFNTVKDALECRSTKQEHCIQQNLLMPSPRNPGTDTFWALHEKYELKRLFTKWSEIVKQYPLPKLPVKIMRKIKGSVKIRHAGILTFHQAHNYGAMLQAWALRKYIKDLGVKVDIINYRCKTICKSYRFLPWQVLPKYKQFHTPDDIRRGLKMYWGVLKRQLPLIAPWWRRRDSFKHFLHKNLNCHGRGIPFSLLPLVTRDVIICGSDQIWAFQEPAYFAAFSTKARRIAYAPSMGNQTFPPEMHPTIYKWYKQFDSVSVRESTMADYLVAIFGGERPQVTVDPTLLLKSADYEPIIGKVSVSPKSYALVYCVLENDEMVQMAQEYARQNNLEVIVIRDFLRRDVENQIQDVSCGPEKFLAYVQNAAYVFTNSYHGTAFSILFHTAFSAVYQNGMNNRIDGLLAAVELTQCHCEVGEMCISAPDWERVDKILEDIRTVSGGFLRNSLGLKNTLVNSQGKCKSRCVSTTCTAFWSHRHGEIAPPRRRIAPLCIIALSGCSCYHRFAFTHAQDKETLESDLSGA